MAARGRLRDLFLVPDREDKPDKPTREQLRLLSRVDRRRVKVHYAAQGGLFRTWVYVVVLVLLVSGFTLYVALVT